MPSSSSSSATKSPSTSTTIMSRYRLIAPKPPPPLHNLTPLADSPFKPPSSSSSRRRPASSSSRKRPPSASPSPAKLPRRDVDAASPVFSTQQPPKIMRMAVHSSSLDVNDDDAGFMERAAASAPFASSADLHLPPWTSGSPPSLSTAGRGVPGSGGFAEMVRGITGLPTTAHVYGLLFRHYNPSASGGLLRLPPDTPTPTPLPLMVPLLHSRHEATEDIGQQPSPAAAAAPLSENQPDQRRPTAAGESGGSTSRDGGALDHSMHADEKQHSKGLAMNPQGGDREEESGAPQSFDLEQEKKQLLVTLDLLPVNDDDDHECYHSCRSSGGRGQDSPTISTCSANNDATSAAVCSALDLLHASHLQLQVDPCGGGEDTRRGAAPTCTAAGSPSMSTSSRGESSSLVSTSTTMSTAVIVPRAVRPVGSTVRLQSISEVVVADEKDRGAAAEEMETEQVRREVDKCWRPAMVTDEEGRVVRWVNEAYTRMVGGQPMGCRTEAAPPTIAGEVILACNVTLPRNCAGFSGQANIEWNHHRRGGGGGEQRCCITVPCDVTCAHVRRTNSRTTTRSSSKVLVWRLDVEACLSLSPMSI